MNLRGSSASSAARIKYAFAGRDRTHKDFWPMAKVDIVIPCYNYGRFLDTCVRSVLQQSVSDVRILIIDDASTDDSAATAEKVARENPRVSVVAHPKNKGHIDTYNEGIEWASSEYFLLLSADDMLVPGALQRATEIMDANPDIAFTYGDCVAWCDTKSAPTIAAVENYGWSRRDFLAEICASANNFVTTATAIVRTKVQKAIGGYKKTLPHAGDMEMWLRFAANGSVARIDAVQAIYRKHAASMSITHYATLISDFRQRQLAFDIFFDEHSDKLEESRSLRAKARRALAEIVFRNGIALLRRAQLSEGLQLIKCAMDMDHRLRYLPPLWRLLKVPGREGRETIKRKLVTVAARRWRRGITQTDLS